MPARRPAFPDKGTSPDEAGPAPRAARGPRGRAARRLFRRGRRRPGLPRSRRAGGRRRRRLPDHRRQRQPGSTSSPATRSPTSRPSGRRPTRSSSARSSRRWRTATSPSTPRPSTRAPTPRPASAARARPTDAGLGRRQRLLRPVVRPDRLRPRPARRAVHRLRALPGAGRHGPRVRARDAGPVRLLRARHPGRDAGRLPGRRLDRLGRRRRGRARRRSGRPELDDVIRGFLLLRDDVGSDPERHPGARLLLRPGVGVLRGLRRRRRPVPGRLRRGPAVHRRRLRATTRTTPAGATRPFDDIVDWVGDDAAGVLERGLPGRLRQRLRRRRRSRASRAPRRTARGSRTATSGYCADDDDRLRRRDRPGDARLRRDRRLRARDGDVAALLAGRARPGRAVDRRRRGHPLGRLPDRLVRGPVVQRRLRRRRPTPSSAPATSTRPCSSCSTYGVATRSARFRPDRIP